MNLKNILVLLTFSLFSLSHVTGQKLLSVKKSDFVDGSEKSNLAYFKIKQAMDFSQQNAENTDQCLPLFLQAYAYKQNNPELNYNIGICYLNGHLKENASKYLLDAYQLNAAVSKDICYQIALAHQYDSNFEKAIKMYQLTIENLVKDRGNRNKALIESCEKHIYECKNGIVLQAIPATLTANRLNKEVNSKFNDLNPIKKGDTFYFSSQRSVNSKGQLIEKVYSVSIDNNNYRDLKKEYIPFGKDENVAIVNIEDKDKFVFYTGIDGGGDFVLAKQKGGRWIASGDFPTVNSAISREASACIAGNELFFVSDREGGAGACDIYFCTKDKNDNWSQPKNIGLSINTEFDEADLFVTPNGKELYFNSKGHNGMGDYDIFKCDRLANGTWSSPKNMGIPVNSPYNDIQFYKSETGEQYFSSDRNGGAGGFDIYKTEKIKVNTPDPKAVETYAAAPAAQAPIVPQAPKEIIPELIYRIQILACKNEANTDQLYKIYQGKEPIEQQFLDGWNKYAIGKFKTYAEAEAFKDSCGIEGAFIVLFKNGQPLKIRR
ncbi:hypothetical protein BZG02_10375 [Labilibaculum filiforme]|uniref:SPOR domain-containing protein n=1 Tax=Labilibaculum filiforme TaxID=1940526 RepID=A0A2N3HYP9_9BACT|nr:PD40 domain-containing protein [Labilibaculum filiforme]PKQ63157.1 hypothetical protein BZG02_10375 [Labilibaculum filiforme]